jgi:hypothetical protein
MVTLQIYIYIYILHNAYFEYGRIRKNRWIWGSDTGGYEEYYLLGYTAMQSVKSQLTFRRNISPPPSISNNRRWIRYIPLKRRLAFNGLHGLISQKLVFFKEEPVRNIPVYQKVSGNGQCIRTYELYFIRCRETNLAWNYVCVFSGPNEWQYFSVSLQ